MAGLLGRIELEPAHSHRLAEAADLELDRHCVHVLSENDLNFIAWPERALESQISNGRECACSARSARAGTESQSHMRDARQDRRSVEMAIEQSARLGHLEVQRAVRHRERRRNRFEPGVRK